MKQAVRFLGCAFALLVLVSCSSEGLVGARGELRISPESIEFGDTYVGYSRAVDVRIENTGRAPQHVELQIDAPFSLDFTSVDVPGGTTRTVKAIYAPAEVGEASGTVRLSNDVTIPLHGRALEVPECPPSGACRSVVFDPDEGGCVEQRQPEGASCGDACFAGACHDGECVGEAVSCDDGSVCTVDTCDAATGCVHYDQAANCPGSNDPCRTPVCDAEGGCSFSPAVDGTACGPANCTTAFVCLAGTCTEVTSPEGGACGEATPCQEQGHCVEGRCIQEPPVVLEPSWEHVAAPGAALHFAGTTDPFGNTYWAECTFTSCDVISVGARGLQRYRETIFVEDAGRSPTGGLAIAGELLVSTLAPGRVVALASNDADPVWSADLLAIVGEDAAGGTVWVDEAAPPVIANDVVIVAVDGFRSDTSGDIRQWGGWVVALDRTNGKKRWVWAANGAFEGFIGDEGGSVYFSVRRHDAPASEGGQFVSLGTTGAERWRIATPFQAPAATVGGVLLQATGELRTTESGARRNSLPLLLPTFPRRSPLMSGRSLYAFGVPLEDCDAGRCPTWVPHLFRFDRESGDEAWRVQLSSGQTSEAVMTSDFTVMFAHPANNAPPAARRSNLTELAPDQHVVFSCELPAGGRYDGPAALGAGQWVTVDSANRAVVAFGVQKRTLPQSGWVVSGGAPSQSNRPR